MTYEDALSRLGCLLAADQEPTLDAEELGALLQESRAPDGSGRLVGDPGYEPAYDLLLAARKGWERKAAKVAGSYDFRSSDQAFERSQLLEMCLTMRGVYARKIHRRLGPNPEETER